MTNLINNLYSEDFLLNNASNFINLIEKDLHSIAQKRTDSVMVRMQKVLSAFSEEGLGSHHFSSLNGYSHGDIDRQKERDRDRHS